MDGFVHFMDGVFPSQRVALVFFAGFLSALWFCSFQLGHMLARREEQLPPFFQGRNKLLIVWLPALAGPAGLSLLYTINYSLRGKEDPMIMLLAILAIAAASEHLVSLESQSERMNDSLNEAATKIDETKSSSETAAQEAKQVQNEIEDVKDTVQSLLDLNLQLDTRWERRKLGHYQKPNSPISAIVHYWGIESKWIEASKNRRPFSLYDLKRAWDEYSTDGSYAFAFAQNFRGAKHFLTDTAKLGSIPTLASIDKRPEKLGEILGLTWHTTCYWLSAMQVRQEKEQGAPMWKSEIRAAWIHIGQFPLWVHAMGEDTAYILMPLEAEMDSKLPYFQQAHSLARKYSVDVADSRTMVSLGPSINEIHTRINEEYYQAGSRAVTWLAMTWRVLLGLDEIEDKPYGGLTALECVSRNAHRLLGPIDRLKICDDKDKESHRVALSIIFLFFCLLAYDNPDARSPGDKERCRKFDEFWLCEGDRLYPQSMILQELFL